MRSAPEPTTEQGLDFGGAVKRSAFFVRPVLAVGGAVATLPGIEEVRTGSPRPIRGWIALAGVRADVDARLRARAVVGVRSRMPWHRALVLGFAEQGANVLLPAGGAGGPAFGAWS